MKISTTSKKIPTWDGNPTVCNTIDGSDLPTAECTEKAFSSLRAAFALKGYALHRTDPADGTVTFWAERWKLVRCLPTIDTARRFLEQIGGRL